VSGAARPGAKLMKEVGRDNLLLLGVMFLSSLGAFSYFPYVTTALVDYLALPALNIGAVLGIAMLVGNTVAYLLSLRMGTASLPNKLYLGYGLTALTLVLVVVAKSLPSLAAVLTVTASLVLYRFAIGITGNASRALQLQYLPDRRDKLSLFSYIKLCASVAGAIGPLLGAYVIERAGFVGVLRLSIALWVLAAALLLPVARPRLARSGPDATAPASIFQALRRQPPVVFYASAAAAVHFIFEAQIYASIPLHIQANNTAYLDLVALLFSSNAVLLVLLVVPVLKLVRRVRSRALCLAGGSLLSVLALMYSPLIRSPQDLLLVSLLFTVGEIVVPQVLIDQVTDCCPEPGALGGVATFNFFTNGVGLSIGYWLGAQVAAAGGRGAAVLWPALYLLFLALMAGALRATLRHRERAGTDAATACE
jgi:predicted MFS family arabinose efflux permease